MAASDPDRARIRREALLAAAWIAEGGCFVPPDGGSPTEDERLVCDRIAAAIRALADEAGEDDGWKSVEDDPPPVNESVQIWVPNAEHYGPGIYRAILVDMGTRRRWLTTAWACGRDLHPDMWPQKWRPLPPPPKADKGGDK